MSRSYRRTCVAAAMLPLFLTFEVAAASGADPTRANAIVKVQPYESVFKNYQPASDESTSPDKLWRGANDAVAGQGGHSGMAGMSMDGPMSMPTPASGEKPKLMEMKTPMHHRMPMPAGHAMPMDNAVPMPMLKRTPKDTPVPVESMPPGMDMHEGHKGK